MKDAQKRGEKVKLSLSKAAAPAVCEVERIARGPRSTAESSELDNPHSFRDAGWLALQIHISYHYFLSV